MKLVLAAIGLGVLLASPVSGQDRAVSQLLDKTAAYVSGFEHQLAGIVAEETYIQVAGAARRELKSDLLLIPVAGEARYVEFRDVFEVDGRPVRNREDRLSRLFLDSSASANAQLRAIAEESARYNIGNVQRTVNIPTLALVFLRSENQRAATFTLTSRIAPELTRLSIEVSATKEQLAAFAAVPSGTRVLAFKEARHDTLIRTAAGKDLPSDGRIWLDPTTGAVVMTELVTNDGSLTAVTDVRYRAQPAAGEAMLPSEMRERYGYSLWGKVDILGRATYDHFRTFQVTTTTGDAKPATEVGGPSR